jgi:hypothetical protein
MICFDIGREIWHFPLTMLSVLWGSNYFMIFFNEIEETTGGKIRMGYQAHMPKLRRKIL